ncbi:MAG TPA: ABC transporter substrate-binding protein [Candidatus Dormibacteraeota bacterium]|nr:ABC transporter substrate-binding protein [Candidatus Dormibacteraeota bacterium]
MSRTAARVAGMAVFLITLAACGGSTPSGTTATDVGVTSNSILLGNTIAQTGPAKAYGTIGNAENAYFTYINSKGGVNGRTINFKILDDGYNPAQTVPLTKQLVEQDQVFAMFSGLGTQAQTSVRDYLNAKKVPQLFVATGATTFDLDYSSNKFTLGWQPPYQGEARIYAKDVLKNHPSAKIGILYQNDDYGQDYLKGLTDGLGATGASMIVDKESYDVTAASTAAQLVKLKASGADTIFLFTTPGFTIPALVTITKLGWTPANIYLNSVSNPQVYMGIASKAGAALKNVTSVGYIKDPTDPQWASDAGMQLYKQVIANCSTCNANDGFNIYGVAVAYTMVDVLKQAGTNMTRQNVINIAASQLNETNPFLLPGVKVKTSGSDHFPIMQEQVITWNGTGWTLQGGLIDERGTIK